MYTKANSAACRRCRAKRTRKIIATIRKISGAAAAVSFVLILGIAGASDNGAELATVLRGAIISGGAFAVSLAVWHKCGGGQAAQ